MYQYSVFGGRFVSEMELPDLRPDSSGGKPSWTLRVAKTGSPAMATKPQGELELAPGLIVRLAETATGLRLDFAPIGTYELSRDCREITWYPAPAAPPEVARMLLLGQVFAQVLHGAGLLCLHGSAVAVAGRGIAFLAPKFHGKSTLALALTAAGGRLITDDLVAVETGTRPKLRPGVQSVRLLKDALQRVGALCIGTRIVEGGKGTVTDFPNSMVVNKAVPFAAAYLLEPVRVPAGPAARRDRLPLREAAIALAHRTKLPDPLVGFQTAGRDLQRATAVALHVPVFRLQLAGDFDRLPDVAAQILTWHRSPSRRRRDTVVAHP
jgi:hypothetical protein